jgi:hypothetical protein
MGYLWVNIKTSVQLYAKGVCVMKHSTLREGMNIEELNNLSDDELWMLYRDHQDLMKILKYIKECPHHTEVVVRSWCRDYGYKIVMAD